MWIFTQYLVGLILAAMQQGTGSSSFFGPLYGCYVGLLIDPTPNLTPTTALADVTEASYGGYARQLVTWYPPYISTTGPYTLDGNSQLYQPSDSVTPQNITGFMLTTALMGGKYLAGFLSNPVTYPMTSPLSAILFDPSVSLPFTLIYGGPYIEN